MPFNGSLVAGSIQGSVISVDTGVGLVGGPITTSGTISIGSVTAVGIVGSISLTNQVVGLLPQANSGIINTSWAAYNPTVNASLSTIASANVTMWRRIGDTLQLQGGWIIPSTTSSTDNITFSIPATLAIDTTKISSGTLVTNMTSPILGPGLWFQEGTGSRPIYISYNTTTTFRFFMVDQVFTANQLGAGDGIHFLVNVPIVGW